ncbi:MAG: type II secretion system major pseudopilin GspG [Deltaproteobacteria bacterium]|jgi:general secretion pathway protein G|nr:type II secretion system major pseudopilin GspG [Deltaproteobacteria bacterium]
MFLNKENKERGFSLIEVMVVIVILGILASIVGVNVIGNIDESKRVKAKTQIETFRTALDLYRLDNGSYPTTEQGLSALVSPPTVGRLPRKWREGGYIARIPKDPWQNDYVYLSPGDHGDFDIISYGNDNEPGGEGKDADVSSWDDEI